MSSSVNLSSDMIIMLLVHYNYTYVDHIYLFFIFFFIVVGCLLVIFSPTDKPYVRIDIYFRCVQKTDLFHLTNV